MTASVYENRPLVLDDVHSFVLRLNLNTAPGGQGAGRPQFTLEHVNLRTTLRMQNLDDVLNELTRRIELILHSSQGGVI